MRVTKKSSPGRPQKKIFINLIEFFKQSLHLKTTLTKHFFVKTKERYLLLFKRKKRKFVRINLLLEIFLFVCFFETK